MNKDTISAHQVGVIAGFLLFTLKMTSLPTLLYKYNSTGAILSIIVFVAINAFLLWLVVWLKQKFKKSSLYDIFKEKLGVFIAKLIYFVFFLLFFLKLILMVSDGYTFIKDVADDGFTIFNMFICFLPVIATLAYSGIRNMGRTCEFFLPFVVISLVLAISFSVIPTTSWSLGSLTKEGFGGFFNSVFRLSFWTGDIFALLIFLDKIELKKGKNKEIFIPFSIMALILLIIYVLYFILYQETSIFHVNLLNDVVQYAIGTSKGWHMDFFAIIIYLINMYLQGAILLYCANLCVEKVTNYKYKAITISVILLSIIIVDFLYLTDYLKYITFAENVLCYFSSITLVIVPLILLIIGALKKEGKREST